MHQQSARRAPSAATFPQPAQVAAIPQASPKPSRGRAQQGLLPYQRTHGGHRHYPTAIEQLAASLIQEVPAA